MFHWRWTWTAPRLLPWVVFLAALMWRTVQRRQNLWVLAPVAAVHGVLVSLFDVFVGVSDAGLLCFTQAMGAFALGLGVVWLLMDVLAVTLRRPYARLAVVAAILGTVGALGAACSFGVGDLSEGTAIGALFSLAGAFIFVSALRIVVRTSRRPGSYLDFMLRLMVYATLLPMATMVVLGVLPAMVFAPFGMGPAADLLMATPVVSFVLGLVLSAAAMPFIALSFMNETFSERFSACFEFGPSGTTPAAPGKPASFKERRKLGGMM